MNVGSEQRRLAAIMFTDMVGYSALAQRDEARALELLEEHRQQLRAIFPRFNGTEIKTIGDAFLVEFHSALEAAQCAIEIQRTLAKRNHDVPAERQIEIRIGIHIGDVVHRDNDVYGDGVNIASRIQPLARSGGICVSMDVERQIRNALEARFEKLAPTELKNIETPMDLFRIVLPWEKESTLKPRPRIVGPGARRKMTIVFAAALLLLLLCLGVWMWTARPTRSTSAPPPASKSVAVLPFVNMSPDKENEYLSDGITEDLSTALTQIKGLHVPARTSSFAFKGKTEDIRKIGEQLNVATVLEGSVSKGGNKLRISAQLVNVADGFHLWAANYDREMTDILDIRSDISRRVVEALKVQLGVSETERLVKKPTETTEAYDSYLLGRYELNKFTEPGFRKAVEHFKHAIELDHSFALANAGLAEAYNMLAYWNYVAPTAGFPEAKRAAQRALELDPGLAEGHSQLGFVLFEYEWQYEAGEREFVEAIRLNPRSATAHSSYGEFLLDLGRFPEAMREFESARQSDPLSVRLTFDIGAWYWFQGQLEPAVAEVQKAIAMDPANSLSYHMLGYILLKMNKPAEAVDAWEKANTFEGVFTAQENAELRKIYQTDGAAAFLRKEAELEQQWIHKGKYRSPLFIALHYAGAGANEEALTWLERAVKERAAWLPELKMEPTWDPLRSNPRFVALLKKVGLEK
jgi:TolB-like protein/class 3 adenylate cyclase